MIQTVGVDFDGVIHTYEKGWQDGTIYGEPMPGAFDALERLQKKYAVFIHTTRDADQVAQWMVVKSLGRFVCRTQQEEGPWYTWSYANGILTNEEPHAMGWSQIRGTPDKFWSDQEHLLISHRKLPAVAYIDDRGIRFYNWGQALTEFETYHGDLDD